jgi:short-subunit dehydrogenase
MKSLQDKVIWITGASGGLGEAMAYAFARKGAKLVLTARRDEELQRVKKATGLESSSVLTMVLDMETTEDYHASVAEVLKHMGSIDVVVHNAGISQRGKVENSDYSTYKRLMQLNFLSVVALTQAVLPHMQQKGSGHFVAISSIAGKLGAPLRSGYAASKHALHGFFDALRSEVFDTGIGVSIICPGYIKTNISINAIGQNGQTHGKMDNNQAQGISPEDCAEKIVQAVEKNKSEVYIAKKEVLGVYLKRFFPKLLERILIKQNRKN